MAEIRSCCHECRLLWPTCYYLQAAGNDSNG